jgi:DNA-binding transcriptional MerR regulator
MSYLRKQIAKIANINAETLRYYEKNGLIPSPKRDKNGYRLYNDDTIEKLEIIKYAKSCGFTLEETKKIITIVECEVIDYGCIIDFLDQKITDINKKVEHLDYMKVVLNKIKSNIHSQTKCPIKTTFKNL